MRKETRYICDECNAIFINENDCLEHEKRHKRIDKANEMLDKGYTLKEIQDECNIWESIPEYLSDATKDNCFVIPHWQCCNKPAYQINEIKFDGKVFVWGCGSWSGYYGDELWLEDDNLKYPKSKEELYVDKNHHGCSL